jgi:hypothetical protein
MTPDDLVERLKAAAENTPYTADCGAIMEAIAALAEITRLREERDSPKCTRVCQVPCCGQTIIDRTPSGQIPCGDY